METVVIAFLTGFLSSIAASYAVNKLSRYPLAFLKTISLHLRDLQENLKDMPFIYKDIGGDVMNDFVEIHMEKMDSKSFTTKSTYLPDTTTTYERLLNTRKVLFLGNAGVGKTTFQRHTILTLIRSNFKMDFLHTAERPIPIYVPLKAVDNMDHGPIARYLANNLKINRKKLLKLARKGKVFLFLDGYDGIPFTSHDPSRFNFVQEELYIIMNSIQLLTVMRRGDDEEVYSRHLYDALRSCRVWLASRREFFGEYLVPIDTFHQAELPVAAFEITGIGNNRTRLVKTIFENIDNVRLSMHPCLMRNTLFEK